MRASPPSGTSQQPSLNNGKTAACWAVGRGVLSRYLLLVGLLFTVVSPWFSTEAFGQDTPDYFKNNCAGCHTIGGGRLTGPDLKDLSKRQEREWLINFMMNPKAVIDSGDAYAQKILEESRGIPMPTPPGMNKGRAEKILDLIDAESLLEKSRFKGMKISTKPFTDADRAKGREIFLGPHRMKAGGTACISCHSMFDTPSCGWWAAGA